MGLVIEHLNTTGKTLYALIYNEALSGYRPATDTFGSYSDSSINDFDVVLNEGGLRAGYYSAVASGLSQGRYLIEVYNQVGGSPSKTNDFLQASEIVYWNGNEEVNLQTPEIKSIGNNGSYGLDTTGFFIVETKNKYGLRANLDAVPEYQLFENQNSTSTTGIMGSIDTGLYYAAIPFVSGNYVPEKDYNIFVTGYTDKTAVSAFIGADINYPVNIGEIDTDILNKLAYATGMVTSVTDAGDFLTNLPGPQNKFYNGQILRFTDTSLKTQARIIRNYTASNGRIQTNKNYTATPSVSGNFIIFPIGGELNL